MSVREAQEGLQEMGEDEKILWSIDTENWGGSPSSPSMVVKKVSDDSDVTSSVTSGSMSVNGDVITLKAIYNLTADELYRVEVQFTNEHGAPAECFFYIRCEV